MRYTATYSPEDNKLRLYASQRLDDETWAALKAAGFRWAPKQELFVAPMWTPEREDKLIALAGEIGDEDMSLVDRQEARAERFDAISEKRERDAAAARSAADAISERFYGGQPILVGHHSEKRARKDQERMHGLMSKTVKMWEESKYWSQRAAGAIALAKHKERPDVRARRIKGLEKGERQYLKAIAGNEKLLKFWASNPPMEKAIAVANCVDHGGVFLDNGEHYWSLWSALTDGKVSLQNVIGQRALNLPRSIAHQQRWLAHYQNRLVYERAMLEEGGGLVGEKQPLEVGGRVLCRGEWSTIVRLNKKAGKVVSVTTNARYVSVRGVENIKEYQPPTAEHAAAVKTAMKLAPLCNYAGEGFAVVTAEQWAKIPKDYKGSRQVDGTETAGRHRVRSALGVYVNVPKDDNARHKYWRVFVSDLAVKDPPKPDGAKRPGPVCEPPVSVSVRHVDAGPKPAPAPIEVAAAAMKAALKTPIKIVAVPQLFPTPKEIAERMIEEAQIEPGMCVLEPSAGTGNLVRAIVDTVDTEVLAYEINQGLCSHLVQTFPSWKLQVRCKDFLEETDFMGQYPRVVMNPPFEKGADIKHIRHAMKFLAPGGRLVALCAAGSRQREFASEIGATFDVLPAGSFKEQGTNVNVAMIVAQV